MAERLSLLDYLSYVLPGATILFVAGGYDVWLRGETGASATLGFVAAAFVVGYLNAAVGNWIEAAFLGSKPGGRPDPLWGTLTGKTRYTDDERRGFEDALQDRYGRGTPVRTCYRLAYTELQQRGLAGQLHLIDQHIGFSRGMATAFAIAFVIRAGLAAVVSSNLVFALVFRAGLAAVVPSNLVSALWLPLLAGATLGFVARYRRFWGSFGDNLLWAVRVLPPK